MNYKKLEQEFKELPEAEQWKWVIEHKKDITLNLDNDGTDFTFDSEDDTDDCTLFMLRADIGNRWGLEYLLPLFGLKSEFV